MTICRLRKGDIPGDERAETKKKEKEKRTKNSVKGQEVRFKGEAGFLQKRIIFLAVYLLPAQIFVSFWVEDLQADHN